MKTQNVDEYLKNNWTKKNIMDIQSELDIDMYSLLECAFKINLHKVTTSNKGRRWNKDEEKFLENYSYKLSINEAANLLHRSRYATYQRIKLLGLNHMITKRKTNKKGDNNG